ncbi:MAG: hypothetical protein N7Q72_03605, partial [Spiroplasma sp. Tabriz.8]|nr:hypothetical protein [Spiroplasma sp. Tabriz.8]
YVFKVLYVNLSFNKSKFIKLFFIKWFKQIARYHYFSKIYIYIYIYIFVFKIVYEVLKFWCLKIKGSYIILI